MKPAKRCIVALLSVALLALCPLSAPAADEEREEEFDGEVVFGPQYYVDSDNRRSAKFEEYRDVPNGFVVERLTFAWTPQPRSYFRLDAIDVSQGDQRLQAEFGRIDSWVGTVHWKENPRHWSDQAFMLHTNTGGNVFSLENTLQSAIEVAPNSTDADMDGEWDAGTKGFLIKNAIASSASRVALGHQRETGGMTLQFTPTRHWTLDVGAERERRRGTMPQSLGAYFSQAPAEVAAQLDFRTDGASASAEYAARRFNVGASVAFSDFEAGHKTLTWDNQLSLADVAINASSARPGMGRMTFATDNEHARYEVHGGVNLPGRTRVNASFASSETTQDDPFLPMTINSLLMPSALPASSLDGKHTTTNAQLRVTSRPIRSFRFNAWWRSYELDNESPSLAFMDVVTTDYQFPLCGNINLPCDIDDNDLLDDRLQRRSLPYGYQRDATGALAGWSPVSWFDGSFSYEREDTERHFSAVEDATEDSYKLTLDFDVASRVDLRATARQQERRASHYDSHYFEQSFPVGEPYVAAFNEGSRRFYWTDRDRDSYTLQLDAALNERWSLYGEASTFDDDYLDPETGLPIGSSFTVMEDRNFDTILESYDILLAGRTNDEGDSVALGLAHTSGPNFDCYIDYTIEDFEYALASRYRGITSGVGTDDPLDNWSSAMDDGYDTASVGFRWALDDERTWTLQGDLSHSDGTSRITTDFVPGGSASGDTTLTAFPEVEARLTHGILRLTRRPHKNLDYSLAYWYERWKEDNFASDFNQPYMGDPDADPGAANWILLGLDYKDYTNHLLSFLVNYRF